MGVKACRERTETKAHSERTETKARRERMETKARRERTETKMPRKLHHLPLMSWRVHMRGQPPAQASPMVLLHALRTLAHMKKWKYSKVPCYLLVPSMSTHDSALANPVATPSTQAIQPVPMRDNGAGNKALSKKKRKDTTQMQAGSSSLTVGNGTDDKPPKKKKHKTSDGVDGNVSQCV